MFATLGYFLFALFFLILIHEYGHFLIARLCHVKVERFSFGMGKILWSKRSKKGTEFALSLIPLGGYVKLLDETEGHVAHDEKHLAFNNKPLLVRIAVVLGGPLFNFLLAFVLFWLVAIMGIKSLAPIIAKVKQGSIAEQAGLKPNDEIIQLLEKPIRSWHEFNFVLMPLLGSGQTIPLKVKALNTGEQTLLFLPLLNWELNSHKPDLLGSLGIIPFLPTLPATIQTIMTPSPAEQSGLKPGDEIVAIDQIKINDWMDMVQYVQQHPDHLAHFHIKRNHQTKNIPIKLTHSIVNGTLSGFLGVRSKKPDWPQNWLRVEKANPISAIKIALFQTIDLTKGTFILMGRLLSGKLSIQSISGPIGIAQGAHESAQGGIAYYLSFLALVSISLGALNLLPIPMLDGGHLLYYLIEFLQKKPLSEGTRAVANYLGLVVLVTLTIIALSNDLFRLS